LLGGGVGVRDDIRGSLVMGMGSWRS
jgi:hypothetical protein